MELEIYTKSELQENRDEDDVRCNAMYSGKERTTTVCMSENVASKGKRNAHTLKTKFLCWIDERRVNYEDKTHLKRHMPSALTHTQYHARWEENPPYSSLNKDMDP